MAGLTIELSASAGLTSAVVTANVYITNTQGGWNHYSPSGTITIEGETTNFTHSFDRYQSKQWIGSAQKTVTYGSAQNVYTVNVSATYNTNVSFGRLSASSSIDIKIPYKIAQATKVYKNNVATAENTVCEIDKDTIKIQIYKDNSQLRYERTVVIGSQPLTYGDYVNGKGYDTWTFTPKMETLGQYIPHKAQATIAIGVRSYAPNGQMVGASYKYMQVKVPDHIKPALKTHILTARDKEFNGKILQNRTMAAFEWEFAQTNLYGATIDRIVLKTDGRQWDITRAAFGGHFPPSNYYDYQSFWCSTDGTKSYTMTVYDSRGRYSTYSGSYKVYPYSPPKLDRVTVDRSTSSGTVDATGTSAKVAYKVNIAPVDGYNKGTLTIKTTTGTTTVTKATITIDGTQPDLSSSEILSGINADKGYTITVTLTDAVGESVTYTTELSKALVLMDFSPNGIGLGVTAKNGYITFDETILPSTGLHDYGSNSNGHYVRYGNGVQICWVEKYVSLSIQDAYGSAYIGKYNWTFPRPFVGHPTVAPGSMRWGTGASWGVAALSGATTESTKVQFYVMDFYKRVSGKTLIQAMAIGRWR